MTGQEHADPWADSETPERVPLPVRPQPYDSPGVWVERAAASGTITSDVGTLRPAENLALTVARAQLDRGENPPRSTTAMLVAIVERLAGIRDYADDAEDGA